MTKILQKVGKEGTYHNIIKAIYNKPTANIILNDAKQSISFKISNKTRMPTFATLIKHRFRSSSHGNQRIKRNTNWKRRNKTITIC